MERQYAGNGRSTYGQGGYGSAYSSAYRGNRNHSGGYRGGSVQSYLPNFGHGGSSHGITPGYRSGYALSHDGTRGGIQLDIGRFHVLGVGGRH